MDFNLTEEQIAFRDVVKRWVDAELPKDLMRKLEADEENYPFEVWDKLKEQGIDIARRTVAKYREGMNIPSSVVRRRQKKALAKTG